MYTPGYCMQNFIIVVRLLQSRFTLMVFNSFFFQLFFFFSSEPQGAVGRHGLTGVLVRRSAFKYGAELVLEFLIQHQHLQLGRNYPPTTTIIMISHRARDENFKQPNAVVVIAAKEKRVCIFYLSVNEHSPLYSFYCWLSIYNNDGSWEPLSK